MSERVRGKQHLEKEKVPIRIFFFYFYEITLSVTVLFISCYDKLEARGCRVIPGKK